MVVVEDAVPQTAQEHAEEQPTVGTVAETAEEHSSGEDRSGHPYEGWRLYEEASPEQCCGGGQSSNSPAC